jgi:hypothetical protein
VTSTQLQVVFGGVGVVALVVAGFMLYGQSGPTGGAVPNQITVTGVCLNCKAESAHKFPLIESPPHECANCKSVAFYPWLFCSDCALKFVPRPEGEAKRLPPVAVCPKCHSTGAVAAFMPDSDVAQGETVLPVWP